MGEELDKPRGFLEGIMDKAQERALATMPSCEVCKGTLMGGSLTISHGGRSMIVCMKCVLDAIDFYLTQRDDRIRSKK